MPRNAQPRFHKNPRNLPQLLQSAAALGEISIVGALHAASRWWKSYPKRIRKAVRA